MNGEAPLSEARVRALAPRPLKVFSLADALEDPELLRPPPPVVPPFLYQGRVTMIAGREKSGKSTLAANAAAALTCGCDFLGEPLSPSTVLWIGLDESLGDTVRRFQALGARPDHLLLSTETPTAEGLRLVLEAHPIALVVIDTINELLLGRSLNRSEEVLPVLRPLVNVIRESGAAGCLIAHAGKATGQYLGSVTIGGLVDAPLGLKRIAASNAAVALDPNAETDDDDASDDGRRILSGPTRWAGKLRMRLAFDGTWYSVGDAPLPLSLRILRDLEGGESGAAPLASRLGVRKEAVLEAIHTLEREGCVANGRRGSRLTDVGLSRLRTGRVHTTPDSSPPAVPTAVPDSTSRTAREPLREPLAIEAGPAGNRSGTTPEPLGNRNEPQRFPNDTHRVVNSGTADDAEPEAAA